ncbi:MAG: ribose-phosphate pyrophosphokinase [Saccharofermentanales bacterium]
MALKIFSGTSIPQLSKKVVETYFNDKNATLNDIELKKFTDGEILVHYNQSIRNDNVFIIQSTNSNDSMMELFLMLDAAKRASAKKITAVIPYFGYARQDRKDKPRVPISAKLMADLLTTSGADRVITLDLHADQIQAYFNIPVDHLSSSYVFIPYIKENFDTENMVIASPDVGGTKRASRYSNVLQTDLVVIHKERSKPGVISTMKLIGDVEGKDVFLIDDIIDSGGSISRAADLLMESGANSVRALICHPILSGNAYNNINNSKLTELIVTDSIPIKHGLSNKIKVLSIDDLLSKAIKRISEGKSISEELFGSL